LLVDKVLRERQVVASLAVAGAEVTLPSVDDLDVMLGLVEATPRYDEKTRELREAVGLSV